MAVSLKAHVLVVGGGESATDTASELADRGVRVILSLRRGRWFLPREKLSSSSSPSSSSATRGPADVASRRTYFLMGFSWFAALLDRWITSTLGDGGHGVVAWTPSANVSSWGCFLNKRSERVLEHVRAGRIVPAAAVRGVVAAHPDGGALVGFERAPAPMRVRGVVFATGFSPAGAGGGRLDAPERSLLHVFPTNDEDAYGTVAYVGAVRPSLGSIPSMAEYSAALAARVFSGRARLPPVDTARAEVAEQTELRERCFPEDGLSYRTLVHTNAYADRVLRQLGVRVPFGTAPWCAGGGFRAWWSLLTCPWSAIELGVVFAAEPTAADALRRVREMSRERKRRDASVFLYTLLWSSWPVRAAAGCWRRIIRAAWAVL